MKQVTRRRGRPPITTKAEILRLLDDAPHGMTCSAISTAVKTSMRVVRTHLHDLIDFGKCQSIRIVKGNGRPRLVYGVITRPLVPPPGFTLRELEHQPPVSKDEDDDSWLDLVRIRKPVGQWRADHIPAVRSVFDLGVCA